MKKKPLILIGSGGHAKACIDVIENDGKFLVFDSNPDAYWFDDYEEAHSILPRDYSTKTLVS